MDHPNAIYFLIAAYGFFAVHGAFFVAGALGFGLYGSRVEGPPYPKLLRSRAFKAFIGLPCLVLGGFMTLGHVLTLGG